MNLLQSQKHQKKPRRRMVGPATQKSTLKTIVKGRSFMSKKKRGGQKRGAKQKGRAIRTVTAYCRLHDLHKNARENFRRSVHGPFTVLSRSVHALFLT